MEGERLLFLVEELGLRSATWEVPEGKYGEEDRGGTLNKKQVSPDEELRLNMEDTEG